MKRAKATKPAAKTPAKSKRWSDDDNEIMPDGLPRVVVDHERNMVSCYGLDHYQAYVESVSPRHGGEKR